MPANPGDPIDAARRRELTLEGLHIESTNLAALSARLAVDFSADAFGFSQLVGLEGELQTKAVVSDQLLSSVDAVTVNLVEARLHERSFAEIVGPNGRGMPDPDRPDDDLALLELGMHLTGFFRALGSTMDCLAAAIVVVARLPEPVARADQSSFGRLLERAKTTEALDALGAAIRSSSEAEPAGWLEWTAEMRNNVVHRARQLEVWLPASGSRTGPRFVVPTRRQAHELMRVRPHLRRQPWLPDMEALSRPGTVGGAWLPEPATITLPRLSERTNEMAEAVAYELLRLWDRTAVNAGELPAPANEWARATPRPAWRVEKAEQFVGSEPEYWTPPLSVIRMSPRDAARAELAERLRNL
jgi:hypothetical protein